MLLGDAERFIVALPSTGNTVLDTHYQFCCCLNCYKKKQHHTRDHAALLLDLIIECGIFSVLYDEMQLCVLTYLISSSQLARYGFSSTSLVETGAACR